ncbi:hypothetical protein [Streptomyces albipurpureus]|uniref:Uncharacterized protein n=1 Tax=Streptomyces albipurpureus TaxID=2897419 RepID=A0ABT0UVS2_9ACTN|nr:hypothetical protein [Streptomyces sp. CWNU-1]MCM2391735.1 hypothetical protein [Streptomyces sp. CWNU-1]
MTRIEAGELSAVEDVMDRADVFRAAHALISNLPWGETVGVYDVLQVAKFLMEDARDSE